MERRIALINIKAKIFDLLPGFLKYTINRVRITPTYIDWFYNKSGRAHARQVLEPYANKYQGCRCVIIGNGPSLKTMDLSILEDEFTFGLNRIYLLFDQLGFSTTFLVAVNRLVLQQFADEIRDVHSLKILNWSCHEQFNLNSVTAFLAAKPLTEAINGQIQNGYHSAIGSVTIVALEVAYFMGFSEVILIGVDHNYAEKGVGATAIVSPGPDQNHFSPNYFGKGVVWQLPDYLLMENGYRGIRELYEMNERNIVDATVNGKLRIFPKCELVRHLEQSEYMNKVQKNSNKGTSF